MATYLGFCFKLIFSSRKTLLFIFLLHPFISILGKTLRNRRISDVKHSISPSPSISTDKPEKTLLSVVPRILQTKKSCICASASYPGSVGFVLHKKTVQENAPNTSTSLYKRNNDQVTQEAPNRLNAGRSALVKIYKSTGRYAAENALVGVRLAQYELVKRALADRSKHSYDKPPNWRKAQFRPRLSRLSVMSK